jgi:hypothetical protein
MIPKIIHQIYHNFDNIPYTEKHLYVKSIKAIKKHCPEYEHRIWNDEDSIKLIKDNLPQFLDFYMNLRYKIQRVDFIKYMVLYVYGGIFVDMDDIILRSLNPLLNRNILYIDEIKSLKTNVKNKKKNRYGDIDFFGSEKNCFLWLLIMTKCVKDYPAKANNPIYDSWKGRFVLQTTGTYFFNRAMAKFVGNQIDGLPIKYYVDLEGGIKSDDQLLNLGYYFIDHKSGSWTDRKIKLDEKTQLIKR